MPSALIPPVLGTGSQPNWKVTPDFLAVGRSLRELKGPQGGAGTRTCGGEGIMGPFQT